MMERRPLLILACSTMATKTKQITHSLRVIIAKEQSPLSSMEDMGVDMTVVPILQLRLFLLQLEQQNRSPMMPCLVHNLSRVKSLIL